MATDLLENTRVTKATALVFPQLLIDELPVSERSKQTVLTARRDIQKILCGESDKLLVIVGPCSIHDPHAAVEYARKLKAEAQKHENSLLVVMRVYFEKPRTTIGWKGLINDPDLDSSFDVNKGLRIARRLLSDITSLGVPIGCEYLDTIVPQYTSDFVSWCAIGARTTECQLHRELASGLSFPVGFKNSTGGCVDIAVEACVAARHPHVFLGMTKHGLPAIYHSIGNNDCHIILRGFKNGTNYSPQDVSAASELLKSHQCNEKLMIDFSHGNSQKDHRKQCVACEAVCPQIEEADSKIMGVMIESHLYEGSQSLPPPQGPITKTNSDLRIKAFSMCQETHVLSQMRYGVSITDKCISFSDTVGMLAALAKSVEIRRREKNG